ncbi:MAG: type II toxin-antitoxin system VapC family toxin [Chloroflexi bacterium]|nr:type II toxin-antitoxin system VapC family toxin [Chloroflexota bacterium]
MIIDSSAIAAILFREPDIGYFAGKIADAWPRRMSVASLLETTLVVEGRGGSSTSFDLDALLENYEIELVPVDLEQAEAARVAWRRFGRGNHPARLNFGDCFSYALAKTTGEPLLFKGNDFAQTDIEPA